MGHAKSPSQAPAKRSAKTPSYVVELPLRTCAEDERRLNDRLLCGARLHNVILQQGLEIVNTMRAHPNWAAAHGIRDLDKRKEAYDALRDQHHFTSAHFDAFITRHARAAGFHGRIGSQERQAIAKRVFQSLNKWVLGKGSSALQGAQPGLALDRRQEQPRDAALVR